MRGNVKWFDDAKGFGFVTGVDAQDYFAHYSAIDGEGRRTLVDGAAVDFEPTTGAKGLRAEKIRLVA